MDDRKKGPYEVGYGKPPKSGQFKPGCWRPPNATASALSLRSRRPTLKTAGWCSAC